MRDTKRELIEQAEVLVRARGYSGFSFAHLSDVVGIRKASIHHHFRTKDDLARAMMAAYNQRSDEALDAIMAETGDALERIEAYASLHLMSVEQSLGCLGAVMATELTMLPDAIRADLSKFFSKNNRWLGKVLKEGVRNGEIRAGIDISSSARLIASTLQGALMMERVIGNPAGFRKVLKTLLQSIAAHDLKGRRRTTTVAVRHSA